MSKKSWADGEFCPLVQGACKQKQCAFWTQVQGVNPQTGEQINQFGCAVAWLPLLLIDQTQQVRHQAAAADGARNALATLSLAQRIRSLGEAADAP